MGREEGGRALPGGQGQAPLLRPPGDGVHHLLGLLHTSVNVTVVDGCCEVISIQRSLASLGQTVRQVVDVAGEEERGKDTSLRQPLSEVVVGGE